VGSGTLVRWSEHWHRERPGDILGQLGIVVGSQVFEREPGEGTGLITFPYVHWEGQTSSSLTHPDNVDVADSVYARRLSRRR